MKTKKIEKQINKIINEADQVPNYVLNQTRSYIKMNPKYEKRYPVFRKFSFRIVSVISAFILLICVVVPIVIIDTKEEPTFGDSEGLDPMPNNSLVKEEISSIEQYNLEQQTNYFSFNNLEIDSSYLVTSSSNEDFLMLEENYSYQDGKIQMYLHSVEYSLNKDKLYIQNYNQDFVREIEILSCVVNEHTTRIYFKMDKIGYYITMEDIEDYRSLLVEMLQG